MLITRPFRRNYARAGNTKFLMHGTLGAAESGPARPEKLDVNLQEPRTSEHVITEPFLGVPLYFSQHLVSRLSAARNLLAGFMDGIRL